MVLCRYFLSGNDCPYYENCWNDHLDVREFVRNEMEPVLRGNQWPISCFGPFPEKPSIPNYIEDQSFEEVRMMYYGAGNVTIMQSCLQYNEILADAHNKIGALLEMDDDVMETLIHLYNSQPANNEYYGNGKRNPFDVDAWAESNSTPAASKALSSKSGGGATGKPKKWSLDLSGFNVNPSEPIGASKSFPLKSGGNVLGSGFAAAQSEQPSSQNTFRRPNNQTTKNQQLNKTTFGDSGQQRSPHPEPSSEDECKEFYLKAICSKLDSMLERMNTLLATCKLQEEKQISSVTPPKTSNKPVKPGEDKEPGDCSSSQLATRSKTSLLIKPKRKQNSDKTKQEIKSTIDPIELSIQVNSVQKSANGSIVVHCKNEESVLKFQAEVERLYADKYDLETLCLPKPTIRITEIESDIYEDDLVEIIRKQNKLDNEMTLVNCSETSHDQYTAIIEVDKSLYEALMAEDEPYLNIGWKKCQVYEYLNVNRCFNCWGFNHLAKACRKETTCPRCGNQHDEERCKSRQLRCTNCTKANRRMRLKVDVQHDARSDNCHIYLKKLDAEREKINC